MNNMNYQKVSMLMAAQMMLGLQAPAKVKQPDIQITKFRASDDPDFAISKGLKRFEVDGQEVYALNLKNAIRKINNKKKENESNA